MHAGGDAALDEVDDPVGQQLGVDAEVAVVAQRVEHRVRDAADPDLQRRAVGDALHDGAAIARSRSSGFAIGTATSGRSHSQ